MTDPTPGTLEAKALGCLCGFTDVGDAESGPRVVPVLSYACPLHGERDPLGLDRVCAICGVTPVGSSDPETDFCRGCWSTGRSEERDLDAPGRRVLRRLRALPGVETANVWQTGGGCMVLAVTLDDQTLITGSYPDDAGIPPAEGPWGLIVSETEEAWSEWDETRIDLDVEMPSRDDEGLLAVVAGRASVAARRA